MAVYGNSINKFDLISNIYEQNLVFESIDITLNEGVGDVLKNIFKGLIKGIKAVIKWIKDFIINILNKLKRNKSTTAQQQNRDADNIRTNNKSTDTQYNRDTEKDNIFKFREERDEFLNTPISDIVKTHPFITKQNIHIYYDICETLKDYINIFSDSRYEFCGAFVCTKSNKMYNLDLNEPLNSNDLLDYEYICGLTRNDRTIDNYLVSGSIVDECIKRFKSLNIDDIVKIEKSLKNTVKVFEDIMKLLESIDKSLYKENNMDELNKLFDKYYELEDKIEIPGYKDKLKNDDVMQKVKNAVANDGLTKSKLRYITESIQRALCVTKKNIIVLSKYIPLYYKLKNDIDTLENYINTNKERILKKYNITDTNWRYI